MNSYETLYVIKPDLEDEVRAALIQKFSAIITDNGGEIESVDEWGKRKLAYTINYINEGYYVLASYKSETNFPLELERVLGITEGVIRFMTTVKIEKAQPAVVEAAVEAPVAEATEE